jgi:copper(I)-binding protein
VAALIAAGLTVLAGCQTGQQAETAEQRPTIDGNFAQVGPLGLRAVTIEYPDRGSWAQGSDARLQLIVVNQSREPDRLVEVRTEVADEVTLGAEESGAPGASPTAESTGTGTPTGTASATSTSSPSPSGTSPSGTASASPDESTPTATPAPEPTPTEEAETGIPIPAVGVLNLRDDGPEILLTGLTRVLWPAQVVPVTFVFAEAGEVTVQVAVAVPTEEIAPAPTVPADLEAEAEE